MFVPVIIVLTGLLGFALVNRTTGIARAKDPNPRTVAGGAPIPQGFTPYHLAELMRTIRRGVRPSEFLVNAAMRECFRIGDFETVLALQVKFGDPEAVLDPAEDGAETEEAGADGGEPSETVTVSGKSSPLDGVSNAEWEEFVSKLATEKPEFRGERHVGTYRQSRERLRQLGYEAEPSTPEEQWDAITRDLADLHPRASGLTQAWLAQTVTIGDTEHPVTLSGLLGLLKAGGIEGAAGWLANPADRTKFPHTTDTFLATNGVF